MIERLTHYTWPTRPRDYSLETLPQRWKAIEPLYHAVRAREIQQAAKAAKDKQ